MINAGMIFLNIPSQLIILLGSLTLVLTSCFPGQTPKQTSLLAQIFIGVALLAGLLTFGFEVNTLFNGALVIDAWSRTFVILVLALSLLHIFVWGDHAANLSLLTHEHTLLMLFSAAGMFFAVSAHDFTALFLSLEWMSLPLYILVANHKNTLRSSEAALKYFILGTLASIILLLGISLVFGASGALSYDLIRLHLCETMAPTLLISFGFCLILAGLFFKVALFPFHMWAPDVYEGSPLILTSFLATASKAIGFAVLAQLLSGPFSPIAHKLTEPLLCIALASMIWGALGAIQQTNIKRLLAFSGIGHSGFLLASLACLEKSGFGALLFYISVYVFSVTTFFISLIYIHRHLHEIEEINDLRGLAHHNPLIATLLSASVFSLMGIPPFAGFFAKFYTLVTLIYAGHIAASIIAVISTVIAAYYGLILLKKIWFETAESAPSPSLRGDINSMHSWSLPARLMILTLLAAHLLLIPALPSLHSGVVGVEKSLMKS